MLLPIHSPKKGKLRVIGYVSGSGNSLWKAYELQQEMEKSQGGCPFEIVGMFASKAQCKAVETAQSLGIPYVAMDIKAYYEKKEKPITDLQTRADFDKEAIERLEPMKGDIILLAGYVWATTDVILDRYTLINVHPADLSIQENGRRLYAGKDGVGEALRAREGYIAATAHLATKELDAGPILVISPNVTVDYSIHTDDNERIRHYLGLVNKQNTLTAARTLLEVALGHFALDAQGRMHYQGRPAPAGLKISSWDENKPLYARNTQMLVEPRSVAVIGASQKPGLGRAIVENITAYGYEGSLYAVNLRGEDVLSAKGVKAIGDIAEDIDLAVITIPSASVLEVTEQCGKKGVKAIVCITAGFKEIGGEGAEAEEKLMQLVHRYNMRMTGPNCMGLMFSKSKLNATMLFGSAKSGNVALITQSGSIGAALLDNAELLGIGFSAIISLGNQSDVNVSDLLEILDKDENTKVIALYLETISQPDRFYAAAGKINKPILLVKSGSTEAGASAASSHTGSLAGNDKIADALIEKCAVKRMKSLEELYMTLPGLSMMPPVRGDRVCVVTNAGGPGILICDALSQYGFKIPALSKAKQEQLAGSLMKEASVKNPIDVVAAAPAEHYAKSIETAAQCGEYDAIIVCAVSPATIDTTATAKGYMAAIQKAKEAGIPVITCYIGYNMGKGAREAMIANGIPAFEYPEQAAQVLSNMCAMPEKQLFMPEWIRPADIFKARAILDRTPLGSYMANDDAYKLLECFGISYAKNLLLKDAKEIGSLDIDFPVVAKIEHPEILHKSDAGGVVLNIGDKDKLLTVYETLLEKFPGAAGVLVQEQLPKDVELIIGSAGDPQMGSALMVGMGGTLVEILEDVKFLYPPFSTQQAVNALKKLKCCRLLEGYRGEQGVNINALADMMRRVSDLLVSLADISELDLNPVLYHQKKDVFMAADIRIKRG